MQGNIGSSIHLPSALLADMTKMGPAHCVGFAIWRQDISGRGSASWMSPPVSSREPCANPVVPMCFGS